MSVTSPTSSPPSSSYWEAAKNNGPVRKVRKVMLPREHGAWAMLLVPYLVGMAITAFSLQTWLGFSGIIFLFLARPPLILLLKRKIVNDSYGPGAGKLLVSAIAPLGAAVGLFVWMMVRYKLWGLFFIGGMALVLFILHVRWVIRRQERSVAGELLGIAMLTLTAPLAFYLGSIELNYQAGWLWLLNAAYFGTSVFYIKMKIRAQVFKKRLRPSEHYRWLLARTSIIYVVLLVMITNLLAVLGLIPGLAPLAFIPVFAHVFYGAKTLGELKIKREGIMQTLLSVMFAVMLILAYKL